MLTVFAQTMQPIIEMSLTCWVMHLSITQIQAALQFVISVTSVGLYKCKLHVTSLYLQDAPNSLLMLHFSHTVLQSDKYLNVDLADTKTVKQNCFSLEYV